MATSEHVARPEPYAATGRELTAHRAGHPPSIDCPYIDAAPLSDLPFVRSFSLLEFSDHMTFPFAIGSPAPSPRQPVRHPNGAESPGKPSAGCRQATHVCTRPCALMYTRGGVWRAGRVKHAVRRGRNDEERRPRYSMATKLQQCFTTRRTTLQTVIRPSGAARSLSRFNADSPSIELMTSRLGPRRSGGLVGRGPQQTATRQWHAPSAGRDHHAGHSKGGPLARSKGRRRSGARAGCRHSPATQPPRFGASGRSRTSAPAFASVVGSIGSLPGTGSVAVLCQPLVASSDSTFISLTRHAPACPAAIPTGAI
jgi:hypothetical protein